MATGEAVAGLGVVVFSNYGVVCGSGARLGLRWSFMVSDRPAGDMPQVVNALSPQMRSSGALLHLSASPQLRAMGSLLLEEVS